MENLIKMDDLGVPLFLETPKCCLIVTPNFVEDSHFDEHIFQMG